MKSGVRRTNGVFEMKQKALLSLNKLSDRDTFRLGADELETAAHSLSPEAVAPFLSCILDSAADSQQKPAVRAECVRLLATLVRRHHRRLTAPHLPKMISAVAKRLKDADSSVRDACADAVAALASQVADTESGFVAVARPLFEALGEQNKHAQSGSAVCLSSLIRSAPEPPLSVLQPMLVRTTRLLKNPHFLAKAELIQLNTALVEAIPGAPYAGAVAALQECLKSTDWPTRKAASAALGDIALSRGTSLSESSRASCVASLESCRFDKLKPVRDSVLHALHSWKSLASTSIVTTDPLPNKPRLPLSARSDRLRQPNSKQDDWRVEIGLPKPHSICVQQQQQQEEEEEEEEEDPIPELINEESECSSVTKNYLSRSMRDMGYEYVHMDDKQDFSSSVPKLMGLQRDEQLKARDRSSLDSTVTQSDSPSSRACCSQMANEIVCIRKQLLQIEEKQSNLMDLFQVFTAGLMDNLSVLQARVVRLEQNVAPKQSPGRRSTCTPRPSVDLRQTSFQVRNSTKHGIWKRVRGFLCDGDIDSAYSEALSGGDDLILVELLDTTGPVLECLSSTNVAHLLATLASYLLQHKFTTSVFPWLQQVVELSNIHGPNHIVLTTKTRQKVLSALEEAATMDFSNPLEKRCFAQVTLKLHQIWGNGSY